MVQIYKASFHTDMLLCCTTDRNNEIAMDLYTLRMASCKTLHARRKRIYTGTDTMDYWSSNAKL